MEGRGTLFLALGLLTGLAGCNTLFQSNPPKPQAERITVGMPSDPPPGKDKNQPAKEIGAEAWVAMGKFAMKEGEARRDLPALQDEHYKKARKAFQKAIEKDPNHVPAYQALAGLYLLMDDHSHAVATYQQAIRVDPRNAVLWYDLGMCHCRKKDFEPAVPCLKKAVELEPEDRRYTNTLGYTLALMGRIDDSLACFSRVHGAAKAHYYLARVLYQTERDEQCEYHLHEVLKADPKLEMAKKWLVELTTGAPSSGVQRASYQQAAALETETPIPISPYLAPSTREPAPPRPPATPASTPPASPTAVLTVPAPLPTIVVAPMPMPPVQSPALAPPAPAPAAPAPAAPAPVVPAPVSLPPIAPPTSVPQAPTPGVIAVLDSPPSFPVQRKASVESAQDVLLPPPATSPP